MTKKKRLYEWKWFLYPNLSAKGALLLPTVIARYGFNATMLWSAQ